MVWKVTSYPSLALELMSSGVAEFLLLTELCDSIPEQRLERRDRPLLFLGCLSEEGRKSVLEKDLSLRYSKVLRIHTGCSRGGSYTPDLEKYPLLL